MKRIASIIARRFTFTRFSNILSTVFSAFHLFNPLHPNISMYILHTVLYTFPKVLTRRIYLTIKSSMIISFILVTLMFD